MITKRQLWKQVPIRGCVPYDARSDVKVASKWAELKVQDVKKIMAYQESVKECIANKSPKPPYPKDIGLVVTKLLNSIKTTKSTFAHTKENAVRNRNKVYSIINDQGPPLIWASLNMNVHNSKWIVSVVMNGQESEFDYFPSSEERIACVRNNPGVIKFHFQRMMDAFQKHLCGFCSSDKRPFVKGGGFPPIGENVIVVEEDGLMTLHIHFLAWGLVVSDIKKFFETYSVCNQHKHFFSSFDFIETQKLIHVRNHYAPFDGKEKSDFLRFFDTDSFAKFTRHSVEERTNPEWVYTFNSDVVESKLR